MLCNSCTAQGFAFENGDVTMQGVATHEQDSGSIEQYHSACSTMSALQVRPAGIAQSNFVFLNPRTGCCALLRSSCGACGHANAVLLLLP